MTAGLRRLGVAMLVTALAMLTALAQAQPDTLTKGVRELQRLEKVWNDAHMAGDVTALDELWADELAVTVPKMPRFNKAQSLAIWKTGRMKFSRYESSNLRFEVMGETAVVTGALVRERKFMEKDVHEDWQFTKVYLRRDDKWRVVAWHASEAPAP